MSGPSVEVLCLSHLGITVTDLEASVAFYTQVLGFQRCYEDVEQGWARVGLAIADVVIELFSSRTERHVDLAYEPFYPEEFGRPKIALTVLDVEAAHRQLLAAGIIPRCPITKTSVSKFFFITDPDGTPIQLQEFMNRRRRLRELFG